MSSSRPIPRFAGNDSPRRPMQQQHRAANEQSPVRLATQAKIRTECLLQPRQHKERPALARLFRLLFVVAVAIACLPSAQAQNLSDADQAAAVAAIAAART